MVILLACFCWLFLYLGPLRSLSEGSSRRPPRSPNRFGQPRLSTVESVGTAVESLSAQGAEELERLAGVREDEPQPPVRRVDDTYAFSLVLAPAQLSTRGFDLLQVEDAPAEVDNALSNQTVWSSLPSPFSDAKFGAASRVSRGDRVGDTPTSSYPRNPSRSPSLSPVDSEDTLHNF